MKSGVPITIKEKIDGKTISKIVGWLGYGKGFSRTFTKLVDESKHLMQKFDAYGIDKQVFDKYIRGHKGVVRIYEKNLNRWLVASFETWTTLSKAMNFGAYKQVFLSRKYMHGEGIDTEKERETRIDDLPIFATAEGGEIK